ncbi:MAG: MarR family transcriptional regulator [Rhodospirillaceae bacterium]|nr:MarR family transcriptional regulator [Rhodospirillaceae bacterium]
MSCPEPIRKPLVRRCESYSNPAPLRHAVSPMHRSPIGCPGEVRMAFPGSLTDTLIRTGQSVALELDGLLRPLDLSLVQWRVLDSLSDGRGRTMSGLSARSAIQISALSKLVDRMVVRSLVMRRQSERDQRAVIVLASDLGLEVYRSSLPAIRAYEARLAGRLAGFDAGQLARFMPDAAGRAARQQDEPEAPPAL